MQQADSLRQILDSVFRAPPYQWQTQSDPFAIFRRWWLALKEWLRALQDANPLGYRVVLYGMLVIVLAILLHALWILYHTIATPPAPDLAAPGAAETPRTPEWFRQEARRLADAGRYADAVQADFQALVLALDARKLLRFHPSKTPAEYARESNLTAADAAAFRQLVHRLYGYAFARWPCGPEEYAEWQEAASPERYAAAH